jgi:hypothetical protein
MLTCGCLTSLYGFRDIAGQKLTAALRQARALVALAERVVTG